MRIQFKAHRFITLLIAALILMTALIPFDASALSGSSFKAGRIIDDAVFFNGDAMSVNQIQAFLDAKVPDCDDDGSEAYGGTTRAAYSISQGHSPPFTCLKDISRKITAKAAQIDLCDAITARSSASAAQIIYEVAAKCGVNPKVILVLLQKEQSLVTDDWPWSTQYTKATGYGCPDSSLSRSVDANQNGCYDSYEGFSNQIYYAARQFKNYRKNSDAFNFVAGENNFIGYNPVTSCSGTSVYIQNQATAGLYNYTPYQPNQAALENLYGTGNGCSAYGNRNFWRMYFDWFGSPHTNKSYAWELESQEIYSNSARTAQYEFKPVVSVEPEQRLYARIRARNMGNKPWDGSVPILVGSSRPIDRTSIFKDTSWPGNARAVELLEDEVVPGEVGTFEFILKAPTQTGSYREYFNLVAEGEYWLNNPGLYYSIDVVEPTTLDPSHITMASGETLEPGETLISPDKHSILALQGDGNLVLYVNLEAVWSSDTAGNNDVDRLVMQGDGNLVLYNENNDDLWDSSTSGNTGARLTLGSDGNLVVYSTGNSNLWDSDTATNPDNQSLVNKSMGPSFIMFPGQKMETADRRYHLTLQGDGNLVLYSPTRAIWSSRTPGKSPAYLTMRADGNLALYSTTGNIMWSSGTSKKNSTLYVQPDGNLVIYSSGGSAVWHTRTSGRD